MQHAVEIENIEQMRLRAGVDDVELGEAIRRLQAGDFVKLTFRTATASSAGETLVVRITSIRGGAFRGKLLKGPSASDLSRLRVGSLVTFAAAHIHSIPKAPPPPGR